MEFKDYYLALGVSKTATEDEIKKAYRKLARKFHPDVNTGDKEANKKFQAVNEANEVLSDPAKRKKYDQYGKDWQHADKFEKTGHGSGNSQQFDNDFDGNDFSSFFESMFGNSQGKRRTHTKFKGGDYNSELKVALRDAYTTHQQTLNINEKKVRITIPAGIEEGQAIKLAGHGAPGVNGGPNGDLYLTFIIEKDQRYKRIGNDLHVTEDIDLYTAVLGGKITIDTLSGKIQLKINAETQNGTKTRLKGKGFPLYKKDGMFGDLYVTYHIIIPTGLTEKQLSLFRQLAEMQ